MYSRRDFIRQAAMAAGATGIWSAFPTALLQALDIDPERGSTFYDAAHVVILMQENRSFDHSFGTLQGVRGFNDSRAIRQPDGNKVWLQSDGQGHTYAPFRLDLKNSKSTWMGSLPHSWTDMVDALNDGKMNNWLGAKKPGRKEYADMPLTMGFHTREDIPFYYAMADAFTVCDQHFCSSLTGTTPNRLYLWSGTIRHPEQPSAIANVRNSDVDYDKLVNWRTFPELLEQHGVSWKIYQNELSLDTGLSGEAEPWLANFTDNPIEWFEQYHVKFRSAYLQELHRKAGELTIAVKGLGQGKELDAKLAELQSIQDLLHTWSPENFDKLPDVQKNLHRKAFTTNDGDPDYHQVVDDTYIDQGVSRTMSVPAGDVLYQFRKDVSAGTLPTVSWVVPPERFSDHPGSPWYGAWYISEMMNILTKDPEVWKKTIFIITYDENDGYFDHVPPFAPPVPNREDSGKVSAGIDREAEYVHLTEELDTKGIDTAHARENSIGLGFRVPLIVASPWSRGGRVNSEVADHTSVIQFLETFLSKKTGKKIEETNISAWRRTICGDLSSVFAAYNGETINYPAPVDKSSFFQDIFNARYKGLPSGYRPLSAAEIGLVNQEYGVSTVRPSQEPGVRDACPLPYEMLLSGVLSGDRHSFTVTLHAGNGFGDRSAGVPYRLYEGDNCRNYALKAGDSLTDSFPLDNGAGKYHLKVYGPNGFFRAFAGGADDPALHITDAYTPAGNTDETKPDHLRLLMSSRGPLQISIVDQAYGMHNNMLELEGGQQRELLIDTSKTFGWYDFIVHVTGYDNYFQHFAGCVETGAVRKTDPAMGLI